MAMASRSASERQELSSSCGGRVTFSLRAQRESNQRERAPRLALAGLLPGKSVSRGRAFRPDSCPGEKASTSMSMPAARPVVPDSPPHKGPRAERRAILARTLQKSQSNSRTAPAARRRRNSSLIPRRGCLNQFPSSAFDLIAAGHEDTTGLGVGRSQSGFALDV